jgi:hypothetical protein
VLVIIGLLIGGIFVGQSLIHNAQLNAVITEFNRYQTAVRSFQQQYQALPGDMNNATSFWGSAGGTGSDTTCAAVVSTTPATCNGNGDGVINISNAVGWEWLRFWQHLANAKMIEGAYTGTGNPYSAVQASNTATPNVNVPPSRYGSNAGWSILNAVRNNLGGIGNSEFSITDYGTGHVFMLGAPSGGWMTESPVLTPKDAWAIDKKIDDGKPAAGNVIAMWWGTCSTAASAADLTGTYKLSTTTGVCTLSFNPGF